MSVRPIAVPAVDGVAPPVQTGQDRSMMPMAVWSPHLY